MYFILLNTMTWLRYLYRAKKNNLAIFKSSYSTFSVAEMDNHIWWLACEWGEEFLAFTTETKKCF